MNYYVPVALIAYGLTVPFVALVGRWEDPFEVHPPLSWRFCFVVAFFTWPGAAIPIVMVLGALGVTP